MATRMETEGDPTVVAEEPQVELNQADVEELGDLPGIGRVLAERIVSYRDEHGPFLFKEDLREVPGIGATLYEDIEDRLTVTVPTAEELSGEAQEDDEESGNGKAPEFEVTELERTGMGEPTEAEPHEEPMTYTTPPPLPASALPQESPLDEEPEETYTTPAPMAVSTGTQALPELPPEETEVASIEEEEPGDEPAERQVEPEARREPTREPRAPQQGLGWVWTAVLGAVLGGILGMVLTLLVFAGINGSIDVNRSQAMNQMRGQVNELNVELDAIQGDISTLQGDVSGLRERVEVLSGLTARMEQAEDALEAFTIEIQALQDETDALTTSLSTLADDVSVLSETLDEVEDQTERATTFFEGLQELMQDIFGEPAEPQSASPETVEEVDA